MGLNLCRYKTFVVFKSVTFEFFLKIMESVFHKDLKCFKSDTLESETFFVTFKSVTFEKFHIFLENTINIIPNTLHDFQKKIQK